MSLRALADRLGIVAEYQDQTGKETRRTSDETRAALLAVMGIDARDDAAAARALRELEEEERRDAVAPVRVVVEQAGRAPATIAARRPAGASGAIEWTIELREEGGDVTRGEGRIDDAGDELEIPLPRALARGYHTLRVSLRSGRVRSEGEQLLIVVPAGCPDPLEKLGGHPGFGVVANLYAVRSARNWGAGDLTDLGDLLEWAAAHGAAFVGVNPLHVLRNRGGEISPYSPISRLFRNPLYIDVEAVPELGTSLIA
ncbi:MAG TPA: 4-alpha-glucanotransferase, partial [Gemmatimonadaceae bacterium]|nr:4-alpha-glucanotransferase [Gemmatimonadaceae bacterium]